MIVQIIPDIGLDTLKDIVLHLTSHGGRNQPVDEPAHAGRNAVNNAARSHKFFEQLTRGGYALTDFIGNFNLTEGLLDGGGQRFDGHTDAVGNDLGRKCFAVTIRTAVSDVFSGNWLGSLEIHVEFLIGF